MNYEIYEVLREDYSSFLRTIKTKARRIENNKIDKNHLAIDTYSIKTGKLLARRLTDIREQNSDPEKYYIFNTPDTDESIAPTPSIQIQLNSKEEVQNFLTALNKIQKEHNNG